MPKGEYEIFEALNPSSKWPPLEAAPLKSSWSEDATSTLLSVAGQLSLRGY